MSDKEHIKRSFSRAALQYNKYAFLQKEIGIRLVDRLSWIKCTPQTIVDIGAGTCSLATPLRALHPDAQYYPLDISFEMCRLSADSLCADAYHLPFMKNSVDLVISNCAMQWVNTAYVFAQIEYILKPGGIFIFSTFGPDTLKELKRSWAEVDTHSHVNTFEDMHTIGDQLHQLKLTDPVMDRENLTIDYPSVKDLLLDLKRIGASHVCNQKRGLTSPRALQKMYAAYESFKSAENTYPATYEVLYGHAQKRPSESNLPDGAFSVTILD